MRGVWPERVSRSFSATREKSSEKKATSPSLALSCATLPWHVPRRDRATNTTRWMNDRILVQSVVGENTVPICALGQCEALKVCSPHRQS